MTGSASRSEARARRLAALAAVLGGLLGSLIGLASADWNRRAVSDAWQRAAPRAIAADRVAVVLIDNASIATVGPWPWPRYYLARLTERIAQSQPKVIAFDVIFPDPDAFSPRIFASLYPEFSGASTAELDTLPDMDQAFARVIGSAPVLLPRLAVPHDGIDPDAVLIDPEIEGRPPAGTLRAARLMTSLPLLDDVAFAHAVLNGPPDSDGVVRRVPLTVLAGDRPMPGMAVELARIALGTEQLVWQGDRLALADRLLPADDNGSLPLRMGLFPESGIIRADEVLAGRVPPGALRGKVVLIGLGADGTSDVVPTPVSTTEMGVLVQAQAVDAILTRNWLERPGWTFWAELAAALALLLLVLGAGWSRRYRLLGLALLVAAALPLASFLVFDRANLVLDPVWPILVGLGAVLAMWAVLFLQNRAERARLAAELVEQRVAAAEQEGELRAARRIQLGMVPSPDRLAALASEVDIGAVLRPAKSVGGDFYDAALFAPGRLLFVIGDVTGKGVPAALYMALSKALAKSVLTRSEGALGEAMAQLNRELMAEADDEMGVTMLAGLLDCASGELMLVNAGHENPLIVRANGAIEIMPMRGGPPFCVIDFPYPTEHGQLAPGDTLVLITDGATEAQDAGHRLFGSEGVMAALAASDPGGASALAENLADAVLRFEAGTDPSDDLTIMALRYLGSAASG